MKKSAPITIILPVQLTPKISVQGKVVHFSNSKQTLLECLEQADVEVHYHCRDGFCGACRVTLMNGEIIYPKGEPLALLLKMKSFPVAVFQ